MAPLVNLVGQRFGKLVVQVRVGCDAHGQKRYFCVCDCTKTKLVTMISLTRGHATCCGCTHNLKNLEAHPRHPLFSTQTHDRYRRMLSKCFYPEAPSYRKYGARGILVCPPWKESFDTFLKDMGQCPLGLTIRRKNTNGHYEPINCKWATA